MSAFDFGMIPEVLGIVLTLALNAVLVAGELALIKLTFSHFHPGFKERLEEFKFLSLLVDKGDRSHRVIRIGIATCLFLYAIQIYPILFDLFSGWESLLWGGPFLSGIFAVLVALALHHFVGELIPRSIGLAHPIDTLRASKLLISVLVWLTKPLRFVLTNWTRLSFRLLGGENLPSLDSLELETQIESLKTEAPEMSTVAQLILKNALSMRDLVVADVLLPRNQVKYFDLNLPLEENLAMAKESGHTRFPLCFGDLDHCLGLIHIKDIFRYRGDLKEIDLRKMKRNLIRIDGEEPLEQALTKLLSHKIHMALVIDEFRGTEGVLTLERILEQLVGEIRDEFDVDEEVLIKEVPHLDQVLMSGLTPIHEIESKYGIEFDNEEVSTLGGLITSALGRIPEKGETLLVEPLEIEVTEVDETRVVEARIKVQSVIDAAEEESSD